MVDRDTLKALLQSEKVSSHVSPESSGEGMVSQDADTHLASTVQRMETTERQHQDRKELERSPKQQREWKKQNAFFLLRRSVFTLKNGSSITSLSALTTKWDNCDQKQKITPQRAMSQFLYMYAL